MNFLVVTYDVDREHVKVKQAMIQRGYMKTWTAKNNTYYLPNTTLWKQEGSTDQAIEDIRAVCQPLGVKLLRAVSVIANSWSAIEGENFDK